VILSYQWQENRGSGWNILSNSDIYSGVNTADLGVLNTLIFMNNYQYRCILDNSVSTVTTNSATLAIKFSADGITVIHDSPIVGGTVINQAVKYMIRNNKISGNAKVDYIGEIRLC
jgi:hypothetical protein